MNRLQAACTRISKALGIVILDKRRAEGGRQHEVYRLDCSDGQIYTLRLPKDDLAADLDKRGSEMLKQICTLRPKLQVPQPIYECEEFALLRYLDGTDLLWDTTKLTREARCKFLDGFAAFLIDLWTCPVGNKTEYCSYKDWIYEEIDIAFCRSLRPNSGWGDPVSFLYRRAQVAKLVPHTETDLPTIQHGDLHAGNILTCNNEFSGVIDWDWALVVPAAAAIHHPLFMANIPGWFNCVPDDMSFEEDRAYLEKVIRKLVEEMDNPDAQHIPVLLSSCFERQFLQLSLRNKVINSRYIEQRYKSADKSTISLEKQLQEFMAANPDMQVPPGILDL